MTRERIVRDSDVQFRALDGTDLRPAAAMAQCLDEHWVPRTMLRRMLELRRGLDDVAAERLEAVRTEYLRALVAVPQLVVRCRSLYGSRALARDLQSASGEREALGRLLEAGAVVPLLLTERSPVAEPEPGPGDAGFAAWRRLCGEVRVTCVRLTWSDGPADAAAAVSELRRRFGWFASGVHQLDPRTLARALGLGGDDDVALGQRLAQVALWCAAWAGMGRPLTRDELYREFVVTDGSAPQDGRYDAGKPLAGELKQLLDLQRSVNLPDALGRFAIVPADGLQRPALQEWRVPAADLAPVSVAELAGWLRSVAPPSGPESEPAIASFGVLAMVDVEAVRRTEAWTAYAESLERLLAGPVDLADPVGGVAAFSERYTRLIRVATSVAKWRSPGLPTEPWVPAAELVVEVAGATLSVIPGRGGSDAMCAVAGRVSSQAAGKPVPFSVRLAVRGLTERGSRADLGWSVPLFRGRMDDPAEQWPALLAAFGLRAEDAAPAHQLPAERIASLEAPGADPT